MVCADNILELDKVNIFTMATTSCDELESPAHPESQPLLMLENGNPSYTNEYTFDYIKDYANDASLNTSVDDASKDTEPLGRATSITINDSLGTRQLGLRKIEGSFWSDASHFEEGTIPHSVAIALVIGIVSGIAAFLYYKCLFFLLDYLWHDLPEKYVIGHWKESMYVLWIPIVGFSMSLCVGLSFVVLGEPGDLAYIVNCVHEKSYVSMNHILPMLAASQSSILGGGSLGPEAPLVAICAALGGFISRRVFNQRKRNLVRKHTLMGMAAALAAFFGCPLGGGLFALEVNNRFGMEYYEHAVEVIFCGDICLAVFRFLAGLPIGPIYDFQQTLPDSDSPSILCGACIGLIGAGIAVLFSKMHGHVMSAFKSLRLLESRNAVARALVGGLAIISLGMVFPQTLFWGEMEFQTIATLSPAKSLAHVFPTSGLFGFEMNSFLTCFLVGLAKLVAISFTVAGGYRGGFIFPFFAAGAAFGRALTFIFPSIPMPVACLCFAASINVAITRTSLSTPIILIYLSAQQNAIAPALAASLVSLFATYYTPFIKSQVPRSFSFLGEEYV